MVNFIGKSLLFSLQKRFLQSTTAVCSVSSAFTVQFLVSSCGLSLESAVLASKKLELDEKNIKKPRAVREFFKSHGFDDTHLTKLIEKLPEVLNCRVHNNLKPKFEFFIDNGFVGQLLTKLILSNPQFLLRSLDSHIKPTIEFLKGFIDINENIVLASKRSPWLLTNNLKVKMQPNTEFLLKEGVPAKAISKLIVRQPGVVLGVHDRMVDVVKSVKNLGIQPEAPAYVAAIRVMFSVSESNLRKKMDMLRSMGWTEEDIVLVFKRVPNLLIYSEEKLRSGLDFYANNLNWGPQTIITYPFLLTSSIDKRIRPRYNILKVLELKKLIKLDENSASWLNLSEHYFFKNCVLKYVDEFPGLLNVYQEQTGQKI